MCFCDYTINKLPFFHNICDFPLNKEDLYHVVFFLIMLSKIYFLKIYEVVWLNQAAFIYGYSRQPGIPFVAF